MPRIILDTDPGIDDVLALLLAVISPEIEIEAITAVSGNVGVDQTASNALNFLHVLGCTGITVAKGSARPLVRNPIDAGYYHGQNGIGEVVLPPSSEKLAEKSAVDLLVQKIMEHPGEITIVAIGPLTNLALALKCEPRIAEAVKEVIIMGGALRSRGNVTPPGEFNIVADPHAAHIVLHAGWPIRLISLDVTNRVLLCQEHLSFLAQIDHPAIQLITAMIQYNLNKFPAAPGFPMHDPLALSCVIRPDFITWEDVYVAVELDGKHTLGETVAYFPEYGTPAPQPPNVKASIDVDITGFITWYIERVSQYLTTAKIFQ